MLSSSDSILLDVYDLHEQDRIVTWIAPGHGKVRGVAKGARRKYSRFAGELQPLAKAKVTWFLKEGRDLARISGVELIRSARILQGDLEGILIGGYMAGHVLEFVQENEPSERIFRLLDSSIESLQSGTDRMLALRYFEIWMLRLAGIFPVPDKCPLCGNRLRESAILGPDDDAIFCGDCADGGSGLRVSRDAIDFLTRVRSESLRGVAAKPPRASVVSEVERICSRVRRAFLQHELKSYRVMQEILCSPSRT